LDNLGIKRPIAFGADWELRLGPKNRFRVFYRSGSGGGAGSEKAPVKAGKE